VSITNERKEGQQVEQNPLDIAYNAIWKLWDKDPDNQQYALALQAIQRIGQPAQPEPRGSEALAASEPTHFEMKIDLSRIYVKCAIPGEPQAWERAGRSGFRSFDTPANKSAKKTIQQYIKLAKPRLEMDSQNRFGVIMLFATSLWKTDADNYAKLALDACKGFVWKDDRQVDELYVRVGRGPNVVPQTQLIFYTLEVAL
jgi:Holliday junction resolvase RusA-like endonuclease